MTFEPRDLIQNGPTKNGELNKTGCLVSLSRCGVRPSLLYVTLTEKMISDATLAAGDKVRLLIGVGENSGVIRLKRETNGPVKLVKKTLKYTSFYRIGLGHVRELPNRKEKAQACNCKIVKPGLVEIFLPNWLAPEPSTKATPIHANAKKGGFDHREAIRRAAVAVPAKSMVAR